MSANLTDQWQHAPEAIALFDKAYSQYAATGFASDWFFPYNLEADLNDICDYAYLEDGECVETSWHQYCTARESAHIPQNVQKLDMAAAA